jgi:CubicO group peptidase (beta-lactamase class C family)
MSKPVSAYAAMKEIKLGKLAPDTDVNKYLRSWRVVDNE